MVFLNKGFISFISLILLTFDKDLEPFNARHMRQGCRKLGIIAYRRLVVGPTIRRKSSTRLGSVYEGYEG